jgi:signal transduction histidine kinase
VDEARTPFPLSGLACKALVLCAAALYAVLLFWTVPTAQGPGYDGPHRLPVLAPPPLMALAVALACPILLVRRWPVSVLAVILAETVLAAEFGARSWALFAAAVGTVCYLALACSVRVSATAAAAVVAAWFFENLTVLPQDRAPGLWASTGQLALYTACGWGLGYAVRNRREYAVSLREQSAARAVMAERLRIARELHDMVAHSIGIIGVLAGAAAPSKPVPSRPRRR